MEIVEKSNDINAQDDALKKYLDALLFGEVLVEKTDVKDTSVIPIPIDGLNEVQVEIVKINGDAAKISSQKDDNPVKPHTIITEDAMQNVTTNQSLYASIYTEIDAAEENMYPPRWATEYFSCLPITVAGIDLYIPLRQVRMVLPLNEGLEPVQDLPEWIMGNIANSRHQINVVDMRKIVYPNTNQPDDQFETPSQIVVINQGNWGLTCDSVSKVQQLSLVDIVWRARNARCHWVVGLSTKHSLPIVDIKRIEFAMALERTLV